jgi:predicted DNA-binding protein
MKKKKDKSSLGDEEEVQTSIRMSRKLLTRAKHYAIDNNRSLAAIFVEALEEYLDNH